MDWFKTLMDLEISCNINYSLGPHFHMRFWKGKKCHMGPLYHMKFYLMWFSGPNIIFPIKNLLSNHGPKNLMWFDGHQFSCDLMDRKGPSKHICADKWMVRKNEKFLQTLPSFKSQLSCWKSLINNCSAFSKLLLDVCH